MAIPLRGRNAGVPGHHLRLADISLLLHDPRHEEVPEGVRGDMDFGVVAETRLHQAGYKGPHRIRAQPLDLVPCEDGDWRLTNRGRKCKIPCSIQLG